LKRVHDDPIILIKNGSMNIKPSEKKVVMSIVICARPCRLQPPCPKQPKKQKRQKKTPQKANTAKISQGFSTLRIGPQPSQT
jgi:hypothetical protein